MSHLIRIIDDYKDAHGQPSDSSIARAIGVKPQTLSSWRTRGIREPPDRDALRQLASLTGLDYEMDVLLAALIDAGWAGEQTLMRAIRDRNAIIADLLDGGSGDGYLDVSPEAGRAARDQVAPLLARLREARKRRQRLSEASPSLRNVAKPGGLEPEEGDLTDT